MLLVLLPYRVKVSDTKVTHFTQICTCLYRLYRRCIVAYNAEQEELFIQISDCADIFLGANGQAR